MIEKTIEYLNLQNVDPDIKEENHVKYSLTQTQYAKCFTLLDRNESDWVEDSEALDNSNEDIIESSYYNGDYRLLLSADLDKDIYTLEITEE